MADNLTPAQDKACDELLDECCNKDFYFASIGSFNRSVWGKTGAKQVALAMAFGHWKPSPEQIKAPVKADKIANAGRVGSLNWKLAVLQRAVVDSVLFRAEWLKGLSDVENSELAQILRVGIKADNIDLLNDDIDSWRDSDLPRGD